MTVEVVRARSLPVPHGFLGRTGGVSTGDMAGLNVGPGSGDDPDALRENQRRAVEAVLPGSTLLLVHQTHSADVVTATEPWTLDQRPQGDALVTDRPGLLLGILTADCAPVLLADAEAGVIGAAHAACFSMALSGQLEKAGVKDARIETTSAVTLEKQGDGFAVTRVHLTTQISGQGDEAAIRQAAEAAKAGCPISKLLNAEITMDLTVG